MFAGEDGGEVVGVLEEEVAQPEEDVRTLHQARGPPARQGRLRRSDRLGDPGRIGEPHVADPLPGRGVEHRPGARGVRHLRAPDQVRDHVQCCHGPPRPNRAATIGNRGRLPRPLWNPLLGGA